LRSRGTVSLSRESDRGRLRAEPGGLEGVFQKVY
jgi:hypothetical protein